MWNEKCDEAFKKFKEALISQPTLTYFEKDKTVYVEYDASDTVTGSILS